MDQNKKNILAFGIGGFLIYFLIGAYLNDKLPSYFMGVFYFAPFLLAVILAYKWFNKKMGLDKK